MSENISPSGSLAAESSCANFEDMTQEELLLLEDRGDKAKQKRQDAIVFVAPLFAMLVAIAEYLSLPNKFPNENPERYIVFLVALFVLYVLRLVVAFVKAGSGDRKLYRDVRHGAPRLTVLYLLLAGFDYLTLKTGYLLYPFIPWVNDIINAIVYDNRYLLKCTAFSLRLLMIGYFWGAVVGLITGIACGYNKHIRYWIDPIIKVLGPIPTVTWVPLVMILAASLFRGAVFIIALGVWFAVAVATIDGITNIDQTYFDAAGILGANDRQKILRVVIPHAMPNILTGLVQGMSSACVSLIIAEMLGVEAGLGWYITWSKAWAKYNQMFAAIIIICVMFNVVTKVLNVIKDYALRWQK